VSRWTEWHRAYDDPDSPLSRRLAIVQRAVAGALGSAPPGPVRVVSMCAGEGRDLLGVLPHHPRRGDVTGRLVELDPELAETARRAAPASIEVRCTDGSNTSAYDGAVPADVVIACGVFGNIADADVVRTIRTLPSLCAPGATVIWTRHRKPPDATVLIRETFDACGFEERAFETEDGFLFAVGTHRLAVAPAPFAAGVEMFRFVGYDALDGRCAECGFSYDLARDEISAYLERNAVAFVARLHDLDDVAVRRRPDPEVWSPLEYACHVRDMLRVQLERVDLIEREHEPLCAPMGRDERVVNDGYNDQNPAVVAGDLLTAARTLATRLERLGEAGWQRVGVYTYPTTQRRTVEWIGAHTVHELQHHRRDISTPPAPLHSPGTAESGAVRSR
jgi:hypothetical protein